MSLLIAFWSAKIFAGRLTLYAFKIAIKLGSSCADFWKYSFNLMSIKLFIKLSNDSFYFFNLSLEFKESYLLGLFYEN